MNVKYMNVIYLYKLYNIWKQDKKKQKKVVTFGGSVMLKNT